jgi:hypothetical protein
VSQAHGLTAPYRVDHRGHGAQSRKQGFVSVNSMSALGQQQTCAVQKAMSALPPIATAKADIGTLD